MRGDTIEYIISIVLPISLLILAIWFIRINYNSYIYNWRNELTVKKIFYYGVPAIIKSAVLLFLVIFIHNHFHSDHYLELTLFITIYIVVAIIQSAYSFGGFISRFKYISTYALKLFRTKSMEAETFKDKLLENSFIRYSLLIRSLIVISFLVLFLPNISIFVVSNIFYFLVVISLLLLSLVLNNLIYFGLISLMIFQYDPTEISFINVNYVVLILSYLTILVGMVIETRMDNRMFKMIANRMIKDINFKKGYIQIYQTKQTIVYQNTVNKYYYVYYRLHGIVTVFESMFDAKISNSIIRKMIFKGTQYLRIYDK